MLHRQEFLNWQAPSTSNKLLWIKGPAGFGKTVLCSRLVDEVEKTTPRLMAYFFLSSKFEGRDDPFSAIRSWLTTMISNNAVALDTIRRHHVPEYDQEASQATILQLFHDMVNRLPGCTFILDGLDECTGMNGSDSKSVTCFLEQLNKAISNTGTRLLITSRGDPIIQQGLSSFPGYTEYSIQAADVGPDLAIYSSEVVEARLSNKDEATREFIAQKIKDRCQGQFQWIKLQEGSLRKGRSKRQLEREIDETPSGLDGLYDREWSRIITMGATDRDRALCLLRWAAFSIRPLTVYEITEAVLMTDNCEEFPFDEMPDSIDKDYVNSMILDLCGSLIEVRRSPVNEVGQQQNTKSGNDHENVNTADLLEQSPNELDVGWQEVHLTHFSVKEYLLPRIAPHHVDSLLNKSLRVSLEQLENMSLSKHCLHYLNLPGAWDNWQMGHKRSTMRFLFYAATFWVRHYKMAEKPDSHLRDESNAFFDTRNQSFDSWRHWWEATYAKIGEGVDLFFPIGPLELAIAYKLNDVVKHIISERNHYLKHKSKHNMTALHYTCVVGDRGTAELLIENGSEVNVMTDEGETPLLLTICGGHSSVVEFLISRGANIHLSNRQGMTPLHRASQLGHLKIAKQLIENGAEIEATTKDGFTPLLFAAASGYSEVVTLLHDKGADLSDANKSGYTSLHLASMNGHHNLIRQLIDLGADMAALSKEGLTPLAGAVALDHSEGVKLLLESGADWRYLGDKATTLIYLAALNNHVDMVNILLDAGASFNANRDENHGLSLLSVAILGGFLDLAKLIIDRGASMEEKSLRPPKITPLYITSNLSHLEMAKLLLEKGADVNAVSTYSITPLHEASTNGHYDIAKLLIQEGADMSARSECAGFTPLMEALDERHMDVCTLLLENGSPVTSTDDMWWTPLHLAASYGDTKLIKPLVDKGANIAAKDKVNDEPIHLAAQNGQLDCIKLLLQEGANANARDLFGRSPLFFAAECGYESVAELLTTESHSELTATDNWSRTPLHYACKGGHLGIVKWILGMLQKTPAAIDTADYWGSTPLSMAVRQGHAGVVKLFLDTHAVDIDSADKFGRTLVWWATEQGHGETLRLLTKQNESMDLDAEVRDEEDQECITCDICCLNILSGEYHGCESCYEGDFDICQECFKLGGSCFDDLHSLVSRKVQ